MSTVSAFSVLPNSRDLDARRKSNMLSLAVDAKLGRQLRPTPAHLNRAVYIPRHNDNTRHLPIYDVTERYHKAVKDEPIGSSKFKVNLVMMKRPSGEGWDAEARYLIDFTERDDGVEAMVERRTPHLNGETVEAFLPRNDAESFEVRSLSHSHSSPISLTTSYPVPDTKTTDRVIRHPWLTIAQGKSQSLPATLEWQVHPREHGALRYTLVDSEASKTGEEPAIWAIYHHKGIGIVLPHEYTDGVLLLSKHLDDTTEALVVATLLGLLRQVRQVNTPTRRPSLVKRILGKV